MAQEAVRHLPPKERQPKEPKEPKPKEPKPKSQPAQATAKAGGFTGIRSMGSFFFSLGIFIGVKGTQELKG